MDLEPVQSPRIWWEYHSEAIGVSAGEVGVPPQVVGTHRAPVGGVTIHKVHIHDTTPLTIYSIIRIQETMSSSVPLCRPVAGDNQATLHPQPGRSDNHSATYANILPILKPRHL
jgi:hypothetical protein